MLNEDNLHLSDLQLRELLFESEERMDSTEIALHIESCQTCQMRLTELADQDSIEPELCEMLSGYTESSRSRIAIAPNDADISPDNAIHDSSFDKMLLEPPSHPEMLGRIGRYEIERRIGSGGMGVVFKAIDTELNRPVAVKVLAPHLARNGAARQRFSRESRAAAAVVHEHVVAIHNVDSSAQYPYLVMQYVAGESLQARVDREGPLSVEQILRIGVQAALGLAAAHAQGIVHRDIKPANILLENGVERLLITDFGLARTVDDASLTHTGVIAGTPNYMSPEQAKGDQVDHRTDLFSLGAVLYFVATGHPPFRAERAMGVLHRICHERHRPVWEVNPTIPDDLSLAIDRLLEKRPARRFANASATAESFTKILQQIQHRRPRLSTRLRSWARRHRPTVTLAASAALALVSWTAWSKLSNDEQPSGKSLISSFGNQRSIDDLKDSPSNISSMGATPGQEPSYEPQANRQAARTSTSQVNGMTGVDIVLADRVEFDRSINSLHSSLIKIGDVGSVVESNASRDFQRELQSLDQTLKAIDPSN